MQAIGVLIIIFLNSILVKSELDCFEMFENPISQ